MRVKKLSASAYRAPVENPVRTSFGTMYDRPAVLIRAESEDGTVGWGETWCNFPTVGAEHRVRLIKETIAPLVLEKEWNSPSEVFRILSDELHILALQSGEYGPISQALAGIDIALWDIAAKHNNMPLYQLLNSEFEISKERSRLVNAPQTVPCYASGINPTDPGTIALAAKSEGHTRFKLKVGFGKALDMANMQLMRQSLDDSALIMIDANQKWDLITAITMAKCLNKFAPYWLEEPLAADRPAAEWEALSEASPIDIAAGENMYGDEFSEVCLQNYLKYVQPDLAKWGGISGVYPVADNILAQDKVYCPHFLGGGIGLIASAHLLAATESTGFLEVDFNANPLRSLMAGFTPVIKGGVFQIPEAPGLGITPNLQQLEQFRTL